MTAHAKTQTAAVTAADVMTSPVLTVQTGTPLPAAAALLTAHGFTAAPVLDGDGVLVGVVTEGDLLAGYTTGNGTVEAVMGRPALVRAPDDTLADVVALMRDAHLRSVPIVAADGLVGIVSRRDVLRMIARGEHTAAEVRDRRLLPEPAPRPSGRVVVGSDGSVASDAAVRHAIRAARELGATVEVVCAFTPPADVVVPTGAGQARVIEAELAERVRHLHERPGGVEVRVRAAQGRAGPVLAAAGEGADLLVVGSNGHGAGGSVTGSVALHCLVHAPCTVTVVPARG